MGFIDQANLAQDIAFRAKVQHAVLKAAIAVRAEAVQTANHAQRVALAHACLINPEFYGDKFAQAIVTNAVVTGQAPDGDIEFTVNSMWDAFTQPVITP